ncbi:hypothetical protein JOC75_002701 [Metabacillus crassostreae]|uniref:hypothetical protein n=1 Tax=Metabacillus crassostreae TaxID=929098 RepID=UPI0019596820|nr:hypothetical protein [Metabacillus crassostreae]MBM7604698.1 hypothetical protein [Metabacillus crassostreae]
MNYKQTNKVGSYIFRNKPSVYVDTLSLISYPNYLVLSWSIVPSTKVLLENILKEEFNDLLVKVVVYCKNDRQTSSTDFVVNKDADAIRLFNLSEGLYYCELIAINSQNVSITVKSSNEVKRSLSQLNEDSPNYQWLEVEEKEHSWQSNISGYTIYE